MTQTKTRKSRQSKTATGPRLKIPSQEAFKEIAADFRLSEVQAAHLEWVVKDALTDAALYQYVRSQEGDRDEQVRDLIELEKRLGRLVSFVEGRAKFLKEILPADTLDDLGELFSFTGIGRILGKEVFPEDPYLLKGYLEAKNLPFDLAAAEAFYARKRADLGLLHGDALFLHVLRLIHAPLKIWLATKAADKGGRPRIAERNYMIERLVYAAPKILGVEPPLNIDSPFVALCERVLNACGFVEKGIDKAVISVLSKRKLAAAATQTSEPAQ